MSNVLQTKTAEEILSTVFKPKEFIIDGLLTQGLYVLAGAQKVGKSWLARTIKEPQIRNINVRFNGDTQGFDLFIKSLLSDYLHSGDIDKCQLADVVDKVEISETNEKSVDF